MKRTFMLLAITTLTPTFTHANPAWWANDGDMCNLPLGPYTSLCENINIRYYAEYGDNPCIFTADCRGLQTTDVTKHIAIGLPQAVTFINVNIVNQNFTHPILAKLYAQYANFTLEDNPCHIPSGNYLESCNKPVITYSPNAEVNKECLLQVDCNPQMKKPPFENNELTHNAVLIPKNLMFSAVKNLNGKLIHPSKFFPEPAEACAANQHRVSSDANNESSNNARTSLTMASCAALYVLAM